MKYRKVEIKDALAVVWRLVIFVTLEIMAAMYLLEKGLFWIWILVLVILLAWIVNWHCRYFGYECDKCGHKQTITFIKEFLTINLVSRKYLKCEKCRKWTSAKLLVAKKD
jgi:hypothetical protein